MLLVKFGETVKKCFKRGLFGKRVRCKSVQPFLL
jgi:hypothetical protein